MAHTVKFCMNITLHFNYNFQHDLVFRPSARKSTVNSPHPKSTPELIPGSCVSKKQNCFCSRLITRPSKRGGGKDLAASFTVRLSIIFLQSQLNSQQL